ncbi:MAG: FKBP-type peptidyl-prolyl cis-trans isomerase, partial [Bacteroidota bacterium]
DLLAPGDYVFVNYTGYLLDGTFFDSNIKEVARTHDALDPNRRYGPLRFQLGTGQVIMGWDEAFKTLSVGTKVILYVPSPMGYGEAGSGDNIPPNATLKFDIEIIQAEKPFD